MLSMPGSPAPSRNIDFAFSNFGFRVKHALMVPHFRIHNIYQRKFAALEALKKPLLHQAFTAEL